MQSETILLKYHFELSKNENVPFETSILPSKVLKKFS